MADNSVFDVFTKLTPIGLAGIALYLMYQALGQAPAWFLVLFALMAAVALIGGLVLAWKERSAPQSSNLNKKKTATRKFRLPVTILGVVSVAAGLGVYVGSPSFVGNWQGQVPTNPPFTLVLHISEGDGALQSTFDIPEQNTFDVPVWQITRHNEVIRVRFPMQTNASLEGEIKKNSDIQGTFTQLGSTFPINLQKTK
jgi:hypothetical protein